MAGFKRQFKLAFLVLLALALKDVRAERLPIKSYTTGDGLAHNNIHRIVRDSRGFLWFCTFGGLSRFDGYSFTSYSIDQGLPSPVVNDLLETREGDYWVATGAGLCRFNPRGVANRLSAAEAMFTVYHPGEDAASLEVLSLLQSRDGRLWISPDGRFAAIAIENGRDEDLNNGEMPQPPAGFLTIVDLVGLPSAWTTRDVSLIGIADRFPTDPEPEFIDISSTNKAAVTLQENNHIVIVDLASGSVIADWPAGVTTHLADTDDDGQISFDDLLVDARREPDSIAWMPGGLLVTANEGDYDLDLGPGEFVGGRDFTIFSMAGAVIFEPGAELEMRAAQAGLYNDSRSDAKGCEIEGVEVGDYLNHTFLFFGAERCDFVAVYRLTGNVAGPILVQVLATGSRPEGLLAITQRSLFVSANEGDGSISIFQGRPGNP